MNLREALSAALLFTIAFSPFAISQDVPEDVVYTEIKKTLVTGTKGVLTCKFKGAPNAVYWKRGSDPENSPSIITWGYGKKYGPRYDDGSCDIDENYSLVIKNVTSEDEGRYICRVSNYKAILIHNYTDVTVTNIAVKTDQSVLVQKGEVGVLPCQVNIRPSTVSWVRGYNETLVTVDLSRNVIERGELGQFNITKDYSLVIYDVAIQHEDEYLCEVADYDTGSTYQDATLLNVYAYPTEPFPSIKECPVNRSSSCTLSIQSDTALNMLTCQVEGYYPHIDLYFMRGAERVKTSEAREWKNRDGTMNKLIEIHVDGTGEISFECVATGLIGQGDSGSMTIHLIPDNKQSHIAVAVVVPVILVSAIAVIALLVFKRRKTHLKRKYKRVPMVYNQKQKDLISYIEIWMVVKYAFQGKVSKNLAKAIDHLPGNKSNSVTLQREEDYYKEICRWKKGYTGSSQREVFFDACRNQCLEAALEQLQRYSDSKMEVTSDDLEHTLWHVGDSDKISELLKELGALPEQIHRLHGKSRKDVIVGALNVLKYWSDVNSTGNQQVMLSLALEKINYSPHDEDFFRIPEWQKSGLDKHEINEFLLPKITSRHCIELADAMMKLKEEYPVSMKLFGKIKSKDVWLDDVVEKNRTDLFDSHQMIQDWWAEQNCSNYEKRRKLRSAEEVLQNQDTKILTEPRKDDEGSFDKKSEDSHGLLSRPKGEFIYKAELIDMALDLIMEDFRPIAKALEIKGTRLTSYKRAFHPSHLQLGTISLLTALQSAKVTDASSPFRNVMRNALCNILNEAGYQRATSRFTFASEPSYGELFALKAALTEGETTEEIKPAKNGKSRSRVTRECQSDRKTEPPLLEATPPSVDREETQANYVQGTEGSCVKGVDDLQRILGLTDEDIPESSNNRVLMMFKIWKERICPKLTDHRAVLAQGVKKIGKSHFVSPVTNDKYHSNETSIEFIKDMLKGMDENRRTTLRRLLKIKESKKEHPRPSDEMAQAICDWVADWTKEMEPTTVHKVRDALPIKEKAEQHRDFNDKLVEQGFLDLAREIMNIEQYW